MANGPKPEGMTAVMAYFDMKAGEFSREWKLLSDKDKDQLKAGVGELDGNGVPQGSLTY